MLASAVAEQLDHTLTQLAQLQQARPSRFDARSLDDATVARTRRVYSKVAAECRDLYVEQARRWTAQALTPVQRVQVGAYAELVTAHQKVLSELLALTIEIAPHTIEQIMTSDFDLGLQALLDSHQHRPR